jgi:hypothetical protein
VQGARGAVALVVTALREVVAGDRATVVSPHAWMRAGWDMRPWAVMGCWQAGPTPSNFYLNFKINTNFKIQNEGLPYVHKY